MLTDLLGAIGSTPRLPGSLCRDHLPIFDDRDRADEAIGICRSCPALPACSTWLDRIGDRAPGGMVIAGRFIPETAMVDEGASVIEKVTAVAELRGGVVTVDNLVADLRMDRRRALAVLCREAKLGRLIRIDKVAGSQGQVVSRYRVADRLGPDLADAG